jgi:hypothetical protein
VDLKHQSLEISEELLDSIRSFPVRREVEHCGMGIALDPFAFYAECPRCGTQIKVRSFTAGAEIEDVFEAVFEWMNRPDAQKVADQRRLDLASED